MRLVELVGDCNVHWWLLLTKSEFLIDTVTTPAQTWSLRSRLPTDSHSDNRYFFASVVSVTSWEMVVEPF